MHLGKEWERRVVLCVAISKPGAQWTHEISLKAIWLYLAARLPQVPKASRRLRAEIHCILQNMPRDGGGILFLVAQLFYFPRETIVIDVYGVWMGLSTSMQGHSIQNGRSRAVNVSILARTNKKMILDMIARLSRFFLLYFFFLSFFLFVLDNLVNFRQINDEWNLLI